MGWYDPSNDTLLTCYENTAYDIAARDTMIPNEVKSKEYTQKLTNQSTVYIQNSIKGNSLLLTIDAPNILRKAQTKEMETFIKNELSAEVKDYDYIILTLTHEGIQSFTR